MCTFSQTQRTDTAYKLYMSCIHAYMHTYVFIQSVTMQINSTLLAGLVDTNKLV